MTKPHALLLVENAPVPLDRRVWNEARELERNGFRVTIISPKNKKVGLTKSRETLEGVDIIRFPMPFGGAKKIDFIAEYSWALVACYFHALRLFAKDKFQIVHVANPPDIFFGLKWILGPLGVKFIFDQHDLSPETYQSKFDEERKDLVARVLGWMEKRSYNAADAVIVTNESYRERAVGRGRQADDSVFTVRNSPDTRLFHPRPAKPELKGDFESLVVFVGTMGYQDGVHTLLEAANHVRKDMGREDIGFVIMGTGDSWDSLQQLHKDLELGEGVRFLGYVSDEVMLDYLASADVGAAPDLDSPLNAISTMIKTMDYMAMGLPLVSFDLKEANVSAGDAALYARDHSAQAFGDAIIELIDDPEARKQMAEIGQARIAGPLSWNHSASNLLAAYEHSLGYGVAVEGSAVTRPLEGQS